MTRPLTLRNALVLAPLLGATDSLASALAIWLLGLLIVSVYGLGMHALRPRLLGRSQWVGAMILVTTLTACMQLAVQAWAFELHQQLGIYLGLTALLCLVLEHQGFFVQPVPLRLRQAGLLGALMVGLGLLRELIGHGTLGSHLPWLTGAGGWVLSADGGLRLAILAPGGFILLGLLIAAWQAWAGNQSPH